MALGNLKILITCKEGESLELLARAICQKFPTLQLLFARTSKECFYKQEQTKPDISILMIEEPALGLVELVSNVLSITPQCSVLVVSNYGSGDSISKCVELGVKDVLTIPLNYELFLCKLEAIMKLYFDK
jgi:DNA-binding NtrC family response regulator